MPPTPTVRKAVIPAAGLGTRFLPATKSIPKEMLPIVDIPTIQYVVEEAVASGIEHVILVSGRNKDSIIDHFDRAPELEDFLASKGKDDLAKMVRDIAEKVEILAVRQGEAKGLGHAVLTAKPLVGDEPFAVLLGDDIFDCTPPCTRQLVDVFEERGQGVIALLPVPKEQTASYGVIAGEPLGDGLHQMTAMVEKPAPEEAPSNLAIMGRYVLPAEVFPLIEQTPPGKGGEIQLTDALDKLREGGGMLGYEFTGNRYDAGDKVGYIQANIEYALKRPDLAARLRPYLREIAERD